MRLAALLVGMMLTGPSLLASSPLDDQALAERLVRQMSLQPGEKVLLLSHPGEFEPLVPLLRQAVGFPREERRGIPGGAAAPAAERRPCRS
jgi:hypothetical protein